MGDDVEASLPSQRPQYHYFYGSTDDSPGNVSGRLGASSPSAATDQDSLVGESLLPTDNEQEDETPKNSTQDFQQLLMTKGNGVHPILGPDGNGSNKDQRPWFQRLSMAQLRETHPVVHVFLLIGSICLFFFIFSVVLFPDSISATFAGTPQSELSFRMPFPRVDRSEFNDPVSNFIEKDLFNPKLLYKGKDPSREFTFPFPTGAFWTNLVLKPTADRGLSYPIAVYPYAYKWAEDVLQVSYPAQHRKEEQKAIHDYFFPDLTFGIVENTSKRMVESFDALSVTLRYSAMNGGSFVSYLVQGSPYITIKYDNVSPVIRAFSIFNRCFCPRDEDEQKIALDENQGRRLRYGVCYSIASDSSDDSTTLTGVQFILQTQEGMNWIVFASEPITLRFDTISKTTVVSAAPFKGVLRLALIPPSVSKSSSDDSIQIASSPGLQRLIYHAGVYPVSGAVSWTFREAGSPPESSLALAAKTISGMGGSPGTSASSSSSSSSSSSGSSTSSGRVGSIRFDYTTSSFTPTSSASTPKPLLMLALPHHAESLSPSVQLSHVKFEIVYKCIKGPMRPVLGSSWTYDEPLPSLGFDGDKGSNSKDLYMNPVVRSKILESLKQDIRLSLPSITENIYGFGKQAARLAQLAHIASMLQFRNTTYTAVNISGIGNRARGRGKGIEESNHDEAASLLQEAAGLLTSALEHLLTSNVTDSLIYDANLGGLITKNGLMDWQADFGNGRYNDHHFHYGYILYASAILGRLNATFVEIYSDAVDALYYDIAHDSNMDSGKAEGVFFPGSRHKIWFDGHSFASGLFPFGNGKSQESSSEAVNAYYGAYLWSLVRNGAAFHSDSDVSEQTDFARLLLATEIRGVRSYWHMIPPAENHTSDSLSTVYSPSFSKNYMVGNLGMLDAVCSTWFGTESLYVHMINFIPITSIIGELFDEKYVAQEYREVLEPLGQVEMAWRGYVVCNHAIVDAEAAWNEAQSLQSPQLDSALSKSQVLYWISTRSGFKATNMTAPANSDEASDHKSGSEGGEAACESHSACSGLTGDCCPTSDGEFLGCCNSR